MAQVQPGWYTDPENPVYLRYWDGAAWTDNRTANQAGPQQPSGPTAVSQPMGFWESLNHGVRGTFKYLGHDSRSTFWFYALTISILPFIPYFVGVLLVTAIDNTALTIGFYSLAIAFYVFYTITLIPATVRRLRDAGFHWAFMFILLAGFIPLMNILVTIAMIVLCAMPSKPHAVAS